MADADLTAALKQAKSKKMFFAFVPKGADGKLIVSKTKIPPKLIAETKKEIGGGTAITGKCFGDSGAMVFQVVKAASPALAAAIKKVAKRDTGLTIDADVQLAGDADAEEEETTAAAPASSAAGATAAQASPQANVTGIQKALQKLGFDPGKIDGILGPHTQAAIKQFQQANGLAADGIAGPKTQAALAKALQGGTATPPPPPSGAAPESATASTADAQPAKKVAAPLNYGPWQAARQKAINDLKALAAKVAATKHGTAAGVVKEIQSIISRLPANPSPNELDKLEDFVRNDETLTAAEEVPSHFHDLDVREPLLNALETLKQ
jgi:peptidoglycan hydrolase-like protein with peptidoglycan-binding domain